MKWKCSVCNFVFDGEEAPDNCPKCGAPKEKFNQLDSDAVEKVNRSEFTNGLHQEVYTLLSSIKDISEAGIEDDLDPGCVKVFENAIKYSDLLQRMIAAELEGHMKKGKWG